jgi:hypothetical protein
MLFIDGRSSREDDRRNNPRNRAIKDTRSVPRYVLGADVVIIDVQSGIQATGRTVTVGLFGCGVLASRIFPKGTNVEIILSYRGGDVKALGRVVYAYADSSMGIVFTSVQAEYERLLDGWIAELADG